MTAARKKALTLLPMATLAALTAPLPTPARAASWLLDSRWTLGAEAEDDTREDSRLDARLGAAVGAGRSTETLATRLEAELTLRARLGGERDRRADGRLAFSHQLRGERNTLRAEASLVSDSTTDAAPGSVDLLFGRGDRRTGNATLGWTHRHSERLSSQLAWTGAATDYAASLEGATDYAEQAVSASLEYALDERTQVSVSVRRSAYRPDGDATTSDTDSLSFSGSRELSDTISMSFGIGRYLIDQSNTVVTPVCPVEVSLCQSGVVDYVPARRTLEQSFSGTSFNLGVDWRLDERSTLGGRVSSDLEGSGGGVLRNDQVSIDWSHSFGPRLSGGVGLSEYRYVVPGDRSGDAARERSLRARLSHTLSPQSSVSVGLDLRRIDSTGAGTEATFRRLNLIYQSAGPGLNR